MRARRLGGPGGLLVAVTTMGCGIFSTEDAGPAQLIRYEIFEVACFGCPASAPVLARGADGMLTLRLDAQYVVRTFIRTAGRSDRCIYKMVSDSWNASATTHDFSCVPETGPDMQMDYFMRTDGFVVGSASDHYIVLSLREYETATRMQLSGGEIERIPVRFVR